MDKEALLRRKTALEQRFNELNDEQKRIQGEHRLVMELLKDMPDVTQSKRIRKAEVKDAEAEE